MPDIYSSFENLCENEKDGQDFRVRSRLRGSDYVVMAPHGGNIEPGTSELAEAIAGSDHTFYAFEGIKHEGNRSLHITSTSFDEPQAVEIVHQTSRAIAIHGEHNEAKDIVYIGGLDQETSERISVCLKQVGFEVQRHTDPALQGTHPDNICNRTKRKSGVQLELSRGLRKSFFVSLKLDGRKKPTDRFAAFVEAVREALASGDQ